MAKLPPADTSLEVGSSSLFEREARFYAELSSLVATKTPTCFGIIEWAGRPQGVLLEDLTDRVTVGDQIQGPSVEQVEKCLDALIPLQVNSWESAAVSTWPLYLPLPSPWLVDQYAKSWHTAKSWLAVRLSEEQIAAIDEVGAGMTAWGRYITENARCFAHQDFRVGNILFGDDELWVVDWQVPGWSTPGFDVAYLLGTSFDPELRRSVERRLVTRHGEALRAAGVDWDGERAWIDYLKMAPTVLAVNVTASEMTKKEGLGLEMFHTVIGRGSAFVADAKIMLANQGGQ